MKENTNISTEVIYCVLYNMNLRCCNSLKKVKFTYRQKKLNKFVYKSIKHDVFLNKRLAVLHMNTTVELPDVTIERLGRMCLTQANNHFLFGFVFRIKINIIVV